MYNNQILTVMTISNRYFISVELQLMHILHSWQRDMTQLIPAKKAANKMAARKKLQ